MHSLDPTSRLCGAEINTIEEVRKKSNIELQALYFLVSDTEMGENTGKFLKEYYTNRDDINLRIVEENIIEDLQDEEPKAFKTKGLRNLVRKIGEIIQLTGSHDFCAIDATGGYKAQIAVAVIIGQALNIPVFYKHERFSEIIDFPPLPINFDYSILAKNASLLRELEKGECFSSDEVDIDPKLRVLLTIEEIDDREMYELNAIGQIYLTAYRIHHPQKPIALETAENRSNPTFGNDHHYPDGFKSFVNKVWEENEWIKTAHTISYAGQKAIKGIGFDVKTIDNEDKIVGTYKNDFGARFVLRLSDETLSSLTWAAEKLNEKYTDIT